MIDKLDAALRFNREALNLRTQRQEVLAANIAHADTPNYKARDFDFAGRLTQAMSQGRAAAGSLPMTTTSARHMQATSSSAIPDGDLLYRVPSQSSIDGNTVEMDAERINFADNALRYEANLTVVSAKIKSLLAAAQ
ncbi:flagellar basal-body rod protein FlgB [Variovorax sp. TBS-050B]|jgi:flagellar basal-body rod protein FlgB|uniref:flagellar basal body rod protein FlgB n=1 Tax=Variovorax sp. TBS-050B TaxID=2940551 RepID=UPI002475B28E|nr:flagellar basal body rod protein FlgB [Variovorax sp. TBS-050B]MDH6591139.1 flagellar basal-body rod protein FlgB [Variovorax sp. TBS-050B]